MPVIYSSDQVFHIAQADAERAYSDLSGYNVTVTLCDDGWHVDYELKDPQVNGGGPHYIIDSATGEIVTKRYEQ